jgi:fatty-acyl-CoA synthase
VLIFFTSGTTGTPKGALLTHGALTAHAAGTAEVLRMTATDEVLTVTPMFHVAGLNLLTTPALSIGATVAVHRRFDPAAVLAELAKGTASLLISPPHMTFELAAHPAWEHTDLGGLRCVVTGGTTVPTQPVPRTLVFGYMRSRRHIAALGGCDLTQASVPCVGAPALRVSIPGSG